MYRSFSCFCFKHFTFDTNKIAHIIFFEISICFFPDAVSCNIRLNISL